VSEPDLKYFEARLQEMQVQAMGIAELVAVSSNTVELDQNRVGRLSRMDAMQGQAMAQASAERQSRKLHAIEAALQRIDDGVFGLCLHCDEAIAAGRLEIDPATEHCINCAEKLER